jgi:integrase
VPGGIPIHPLAEAARKIRLAAEQGHGDAQSNPGRMFQRGGAASRAAASPAEALRPYDVADWLSASGWGPTTRNTAAAILKRLYSWAVEQGLADRSPIAGMRKDTEQRRELTISREEHAALDSGASPAFRPYLIALWLSGQRPATVATVEASQVRDSRWVIERHKTRGKTGKPLVVYLSPCLATLTRIAAERRRRLFATAETKAMQRTFARLRRNMS